MTRPEKSPLGGRDSVRVAIAQISPVFMDLEASTSRAVEAIETAAAGGADLLVFPEAWLAGYPYWTEGWDSTLQEFAAARTAFRDAAVSVRGEACGRIGEAAGRHRIHVVMGCNEIDDRPSVSTIYNTLLFFDRSGALQGRHRKLMPTFTERMFWGQGDAKDLGVLSTDIGRVGGLICGEHLMPLVRGSMVGFGEDIHVAVFPGAFSLQRGPQLEEPEDEGDFWGHASVRNHAFETGAFVLSACAYLDPEDVDDAFPFKGSMNIGYAHGGSSIISPLGTPLVAPRYGAEIIYADCEAWMIKVVKALLDTGGHYSRPDVVRLQMRAEEGWRPFDPDKRLPRPVLAPQTVEHVAGDGDVDPDLVEEVAEQLLTR